jgi:hypothetical protein
MIKEYTGTITIPIPEQLPRFRTKKVNVILFSGKAQAGKTTSANLLKGLIETNYTLRVEKIALADPIKLTAYDFYGWDGVKDEPGRRLLQEIGDAARNYNEDIFCEKLENSSLSLFPPHFILIDDWRYPNEAEYFKRNFLYEVTTIRIEREQLLTGEVSKHRSENSLPVALKETLSYCDDVYNFTIFNDSTIAELNKKLDSIISYLQTKIITY